jgi:hypothetical protein
MTVQDQVFGECLWPCHPGLLQKNKLLEALPSQDRRHLCARCTQIELVHAEALIEPGERTRYAFFPTHGYIFLITVLDGHARLEVGLIGDEGMLGMSPMLGVGAAALRALVQARSSSHRPRPACACISWRPGLRVGS